MSLAGDYYVDSTKANDSNDPVYSVGEYVIPGDTKYPDILWSWDNMLTEGFGDTSL
jgi:hypothetical protein